MHIDSEGLLELIIDPDNKLKINTGSVDGSLGLAKVKYPGHLLQIDSDEKVFAFAERKVGSIRVIDLGKKTIYTLCASKIFRSNYVFEWNTTDCEIYGSTLSLLFWKECSDGFLRIFVGTETSVMHAEVMNYYGGYIHVHVYLCLTHRKPLPIILVKSTMVQSTSTNNIGTIPLNLNNGRYLGAHN